ncbi:DNA repair protein RecO [Sneathiella limimaris]|uniref:DNA repair protein RecO n=1 Tax=Sneathiella limimaris TaxID=1964213 RepID=UPI00146E0FE7|nr:DNA repair protein RecO [Sneathiella limimaris]
MHWIDEGIILSARKYGENSVIVQALTREHGRHSGLVRGGSGKRLRGILQPGNEVGLRWSGRLSEHLGNFSVEAKNSRSTLLFDRPLNLAAISAILGFLEVALPEREAHPKVYDASLILFEGLDEELSYWGPMLVMWELGLLKELGYGLDLKKCAVTGSADNLKFVSPKTGRAVSLEAAGPYAEKLIPLPRFMGGLSSAIDESVTKDDVLQGLFLTGYFLNKAVLSQLGDQSLPARERLIALLQKQAE